MSERRTFFDYIRCFRKMRKPDPASGAPASKRSSLSTGTTSASVAEHGFSSRTSLEEFPTSRRRSSTPPSPASHHSPNDGEREYDEHRDLDARDADRGSSAPALRRKKSRVYTPMDDDNDESDGTQADAEYIPPGQARKRSGGAAAPGDSWANVEARRRSVQGSSARRVEGDNSRRHSMAV